MTEKNIYDNFLGKKVKIPFQDADVVKIARGILKESDDDFIKVVGSKGTIIINKKHVFKIVLDLSNGDDMK